MTEPGEKRVMLVHASTPVLEPSSIEEELAVPVVAESVASAIERLGGIDAACLVVDPEVPESSAVALLSAVDGVEPSVGVVYCGFDGEGAPPGAGSNGGVTTVTLSGPDDTATVAGAVGEVLPDANRPAEIGSGDYRQLFETAPVPMVLYDAEGTIVFANAAAAELVDAGSAASIQGRPITEFVPEESLDWVRERMASVIDGRQRVESVDVELVTVGGDRRYVEAMTVPVSYRGDPAGQTVLTDVTHRHRREQTLQAERDRVTAIFESVPEPIVHVQFVDDDPVVLNANVAFEETFGYDVEELRGESLNDYIVPPDRRDEAEQIDRAAQSLGTDGAGPPAEYSAVTRGDVDVEREMVRQTVDGEREFVFRSVVVDTVEGPLEAIGSYADISDQKERERELERKNERLEAFANIVSHDLRNPLNVISGRIELARETGDEAHFEALAAAAERMEVLIEDLLALARQGETLNDTERLDLETTVRTAWSIVETGDAELVVETDLGEIEADRSRLCELLENLFRNAREHAGPGVTVRIGREDGCLYVADDGPGIDPDDRDRVLDPGYTTAEDGTGYGLSIVAEIAEAHGWSVSVTGSDGGGARFELGLG